MVTMQIQNKYKHLHFMLCLGSGLRKASSDITQDALPEQILDQLRRLGRDSAKASRGATNAERDRQG